MDPKFQQLRAFFHAYRLRSLTRAGEQMHLTQSGVSRLMQQLEEALGQRLFDRTGGALHSTEAADEAIMIVERILADVDHLKASLQGLAEKRRGHVRFSITPTLAAHLMPDVLSRFATTWANVRVDMLDATPDRLVDLVLDEVAQFGLVTLGAARTDLDYTPVAEDWLCLVCRRDDPLAQKPQVTWSDLEGLDIVATSGGTSWPDIIRQTLVAQKIPAPPRYTVAYSATALAMTARGLGVTVMPALMIIGAPREFDLVARPLHAPLVPRNLYLVTKARRTLSAASLALVEMLKEVLAEASAAARDDAVT